MKIYRCDNIDCKDETDDIKENRWIEISSKGNSLAIKNYTKDAKLIEMARHYNIHFCSKNCLVNSFFHNKK